MYELPRWRTLSENPPFHNVYCLSDLSVAFAADAVESSSVDKRILTRNFNRQSSSHETTPVLWETRYAPTVLKLGSRALHARPLLKPYASLTLAANQRPTITTPLLRASECCVMLSQEHPLIVPVISSVGPVESTRLACNTPTNNSKTGKCASATTGAMWRVLSVATALVSLRQSGNARNARR